MAIAYVGAGTFASAYLVAPSSATVTPGLPSYSAGDLLVAFVVARGTGQTIDDVSGWTGLTQANNTGVLRSRVFYRFATASETAPTFTQSGTAPESIAARIWSFSGVDTGTPIDATEVVDTTTLTTTMTSTGVTTATTGALVLALFATTDNNTLTYTSGGTFRTSDDWTDGRDGSLALVTDLETVPNPSGPVVMEQTNAGPDDGIIWSVALRPSSGAFTAILDVATETDDSLDPTLNLGGPQYVGAGTFVAALADAVSPTLPTHIAGDLLVAFVVARGTGVTIDDHASWDALTQQNNSGTLRTRVFYRIAGSSSEPTPIFTQSGTTLDAMAARAWAFRGVDIETPIDATAVIDLEAAPAGGSPYTMTTTGVTTTSANTLVLALFATEDDNTLDTATGGTLRTSDNWTDATVGGAPVRDGSLALVTDPVASAGASGAVTLDQTTAVTPDPWISWSLPIRGEGQDVIYPLDLATETDTGLEAGGGASDVTVTLSVALETDEGMDSAQSNDPWGILAGRAALTRPEGAVDVTGAPGHGLTMVDDPQAVIDRNPPGTTYWFTGHFDITSPIEPKSGDTLLTNNAVIDGGAVFTTGDRWTTDSYVEGTAFGIDIKQGTGTNGVAEGVTIRGFEFQNFTNQGIRLWIGARVSHCIASYCYENGIGGGMGNTAWTGTDSNYQAEVTDCIIYNCGCVWAWVNFTGTPPPDPLVDEKVNAGSGAGGMKLARTGTGGDLKNYPVVTVSDPDAGVYVARVLFQDNIGNGLWTDVGSGGNHFTDCVARGNTRKGLFLEIEVGPTTIDYCTSYGNCTWEGEDSDRVSSDWGLQTNTSLGSTFRYNRVEANGVSALTSVDYNQGIRINEQDNRIPEHGHGIDDVVVENNNLQGGDTLSQSAGITGTVTTSNNTDLGSLYGASWFGTYVPGDPPANDIYVELDIATTSDETLPLTTQPDSPAITAVATGSFGVVRPAKTKVTAGWTVDGRAVSAEWDSVTATAPGGYDDARLWVLVGNLPASADQGSVVKATRSDGVVLWEGKLIAPPKRDDDAYELVARGPVTVVEQRSSRIAWQIRGSDGWDDRTAEPFNYDSDGLYDLYSRGHILGWKTGDGETYPDTERGGYALWTRGVPMRRIAFRTHVPRSGFVGALHLRTADDFGDDVTFTQVEDWGSMGTSLNRVDHDIEIPEDQRQDIMELIMRGTNGTASAPRRAWLTRIRVNGYTTTDKDTTDIVVNWMAAQCGYDATRVIGSELSPMPLDHDGEWTDLLDYLAGLEDWTWGVESTPGSYGSLRFGPWGRDDGSGNWRVNTARGADEDLTVLPLYNQITTRFARGGRQTLTSHVTDFDIDDPLEGQIAEWPIVNELQWIQEDSNLAETYNRRALRRISRVRAQGTVHVWEVPSGAHPWDIHAGDTVEVTDTDPALRGQRISQVTYHRDGTVTLTVGQDPLVGIAGKLQMRADRIRARKRQRRRRRRRENRGR